MYLALADVAGVAGLDDDGLVAQVGDVAAQRVGGAGGLLHFALQRHQVRAVLLQRLRDGVLPTWQARKIQKQR